MPESAGRIDIVRPHENDFVVHVGKTFQKGPCELPLPPAVFSEPLWTIPEMEAAVRRLKNGKGGDEVGLTAELLKHVPRTNFWIALLRSGTMDAVLHWGTACFMVEEFVYIYIPKKLSSKQDADFRPIANLRLLYKVQAYLLLRGDWNMYLMHSGLNNSMVSVQDDGSKSTFGIYIYHQIFYWTRHMVSQSVRSGLNASRWALSGRRR